MNQFVKVLHWRTYKKIYNLIKKSSLNDKDEKIRATAFRSLKQLNENILPLALKLSKDSSAFVRREVALSLRDSSFTIKREILLSIATQYNGNDPWYLETLGSAMDADAQKWYNELLSTFYPNQPDSPLKWNKQMVDFAWRLHPLNSVNDLVLRAKDSSISIKDRARMITSLAFINDKTAATAMLNLTNAGLADVKEQSLYWLSFRQSNDWYKLLDWSKINVNTLYQRKLASMKIKFQMMLDNRQSEQGQKRMAKEIALDSMGGQMIIGLMADKKLPTSLIPVVAENIFNNPDLAVRIQAGDYFKRDYARPRPSLCFGRP